MRSCMLNHAKKDRCLVFFSGWSMEPALFRDLALPSCDVLLYYDYQNLHLPDPDRLRDYKEMHLLAWSMGVWVASIVLPLHRKLSFSSATAIGGTPYPIDEGRGIGPEYFYAMAENCNHHTLMDFYCSMFELETEKERFLHVQRERPDEAICMELQALLALFRQHGPGVDVFTRRIVTSRDRVFTSRNQIRAWGGKKNCQTRKAPHFPFYGWGGLLPPETKKDAGR